MPRFRDQHLGHATPSAIVKRTILGPLAQRWAIFMVAWLCTVSVQAESPPQAAAELIRFGFSTRVFDGVNVNDARAAVKVWSQEVATLNSLPVSPDIMVLESVGDIRSVLAEKRIEAMALTVDEFWEIRDESAIGRIILPKADGKVGDKYLLLVRKNGPIRSLADLAGKTVRLHRSPRTAIAKQWLDVLLHDAGLPLTDRHFKTLQHTDKMSSAVLPVFFGQADACIVFEVGFKILAELNPQLGRNLEVLASSDQIASSFFFFRGDYNFLAIEEVINVFTTTKSTAAANQITTLFQQDGLSPATIDDLRPTLELLERCDQIRHPALPNTSASSPEPPTAP